MNRIPSESLQKKIVFARWMPHTLLDDNKQNRVHGATNLLAHFSDSQKRTIIVDEERLFIRDAPPIENLHFGIDSAGDRPKILKRIINDKEFMWIMSANFPCDFFFDVLYSER